MWSLRISQLNLMVEIPSRLLFHLFIPGQKWKNRRKQLNPTFNLANLVSFFPIFNTIGNSLADKFDVLAKENKDVVAEHDNQINYKTIEDFINRAVLVAACREYILTQMKRMFILWVCYFVQELPWEPQPTSWTPMMRESWKLIKCESFKTS